MWKYLGRAALSPRWSLLFCFSFRLYFEGLTLAFPKPNSMVSGDTCFKNVGGKFWYQKKKKNQKIKSFRIRALESTIGSSERQFSGLEDGQLSQA